MALSRTYLDRDPCDSGPKEVPTVRLTVWLDPEDVERLRELAMRERREPREQAAMLLTRSLARVRLPQAGPPRALASAG